MPYIAIKCYPKEKFVKETVIEKINEIFLEHWGCPPEAINISLEEIPKEEWPDRITNGDMEQMKENMMILSGEKFYKRL